MSGYNFAYLDEQTKRMIRRAILKAVAIPGYQVPFGSREMPLPYGWGTGGIQVTAAVIGPDDVLKVIDQGADDTTNAVSIRRFFARDHRRRHDDAHRRGDPHPDAPPHSRRRRSATGQILVFQVPIPEPLRWLEPRETETRKMHALEEYGVMHVSLYEDIARHGRVAKTYDYPVMVNGRYIMRPSPIPKFDNPKLDRSPALLLFGAGREKRIYAVPPYTPVKSLDFDDHPFEVEHWDRPCALCGAPGVFLDEMIVDDEGGRLFICSDTDYCARAAATGPGGATVSARPRSLAAQRAGPHQALRRRRSAASTSASTCGPAKCSGIVGESGSGKTTLLNCLAGRVTPDGGHGRPTMRRPAAAVDVLRLAEPRAAACCRAPNGASCTRTRATGLRMGVSAGANVGERLMAVGARHYGHMRGHGARLAGAGRDRAGPASTTCRRPSPAACASACRSRATW